MAIDWSEDFEGLLRTQNRVQLLIWAAMILCTAVYVLLAYILNNLVKIKLPEAHGIIFQAAFLLAVISAAGSVFFRRFRLAPQRLALVLTVPPDAARLAVGAFAKGSPGEEKVNRLSDSERRLFSLVLYLGVTNLVCFALNEVVVMSGLLCALFGKGFSSILPYAVGTFVLDFLMAPRLRDQISRIARQRMPVG